MTNWLFSRQILSSETESKPISSCSTLKFMFWCLESIYSRNERAGSSDSKSTKIPCKYLLALYKVDSSLPKNCFFQSCSVMLSDKNELFFTPSGMKQAQWWYVYNNISCYHMMLYQILWCPSISLRAYNCGLLIFHYCVTNFIILPKVECMSIYYHMRRGHESSGLLKLVVK